VLRSDDDDRAVPEDESCLGFDCPNGSVDCAAAAVATPVTPDPIVLNTVKVLPEPTAVGAAVAGNIDVVKSFSPERKFAGPASKT
jgi:hypothetical protein